MDPYNNTDERDRALWRAYAETAREAVQPDPNEVAAYIDGVATEEEAARIERAMAMDPAVFDTVRSLRALRDEPPVIAPADMVAGIQDALSAEKPVPRASARITLMPMWRLAAAAAAVLIFATAGFEAGRTQASSNSRTHELVVRQLVASLGVSQEEEETVATLAPAARVAPTAADNARAAVAVFSRQSASRRLAQTGRMAAIGAAVLLPVPGLAASSIIPYAGGAA